MIIPDTHKTKVICNQCRAIVDLGIEQIGESTVECKCGNEITGFRKPLEDKIVVEITQERLK